MKMQDSHRFTGTLPHLTLACTLATGVSTTATLSGCIALHGALHPFAPGRFFDPEGAWPQGVAKDTYAALAPHWVYQRTDASCSVASVTTVLSALRAARGLPPIGQEDVVRADSSGRWWHATQNGGVGMDLDAVQLVALRACAQLADVPRDPRVHVQAVHVPATGELTNAEQGLAFALGQMVARPQDVFILVNFEQGRLIARGAPEGHLSVVGGWDERRQQVLILDVDADRMRPYWVPLAALVAAMRRPDDVTGQPRGYLVVARNG